MRREINVDTLRALLRYEPETGKLYWRERPVEMYTHEWKANSWNTKYAGKEALSCLQKSGYLHGSVLGKQIGAHRAAFAIFHGYLPALVDHRNGIKTDNRVENLRDASPTINARNMSISRANTSGVCGVYWRRDIKKWQAQMGGGAKKNILRIVFHY